MQIYIHYSGYICSHDHIPTCFTENFTQKSNFFHTRYHRNNGSCPHIRARHTYMLCRNSLAILTFFIQGIKPSHRNNGSCPNACVTDTCFTKIIIHNSRHFSYKTSHRFITYFTTFAALCGIRIVLSLKI